MPDARKSCPRGTPLALYVHVPFCVTRCYFCDFVTVVGKHVTPDTVARYLHGLRRELRGYAEHEDFGRTDMVTAQVGGGTPTMLDAGQLAELIATVRGFMADASDGQLVVEGFPTSVTEDKLAVLARVPGLKFNMGVQTFDDGVLEAIGRRHERADALRAIGAAKDSGLASVGIDLIYGLPAASRDTIDLDLDIALAHDLDHVALYPLWVYPQTRLNSLVRTTRYRDATLSERYEQLRLADARLTRHGFRRYTAFHYARGPEHQHRYGLWQMRGGDWLGVGQGAVSQLDGVVYENDRTYSGYVQRAAAGTECAVSAHALVERERMVRRLSYGIRLASYPEVDFSATFDRGLDDVFGSELSWMSEERLIDRGDGAISLTLLGILRLGEIEQVLRARDESIATAARH